MVAGQQGAGGARPAMRRMLVFVIVATGTVERTRWTAAAAAAAGHIRRTTMAAVTSAGGMPAVMALVARSLGRFLGWNGLTRCVPWRVHTFLNDV